MEFTGIFGKALDYAGGEWLEIVFVAPLFRGRPAVSIQGQALRLNELSTRRGTSAEFLLAI